MNLIKKKYITLFSKSVLEGQIMEELFVWAVGGKCFIEARTTEDSRSNTITRGREYKVKKPHAQGHRQERSSCLGNSK